MISKAQGNFLRLKPMNARQVIDLLRGKDIATSLVTLAQLEKGATKTITKILNSAVSNAKQKGLTEEQLYISRITADQGPMWKRFRAASMGRATPILKRTTHITIELDLITK